MLANVFATRIPVWRTCVVVMVLMGLLVCQTMAATNITKVAVVNKPDCVTVSVEGNAPLKMTPIQGVRFVAFQFPGQLTAKGRLVGVHSGRIHNVRYGRFSEKPPAARIVVNTASKLDYSTEWNEDRTQVQITVWKFGAKPKSDMAAKPAVQPQLAVQPAPVSDLPVLPPADISGPQGSDPGTPDLEPARFAAPMRPAAPASSAPATEAEPVRVASTAVVPSAPAARVAMKPAVVAQATEAPAPPPAKKKVSLNFLGADINDVLKALASQSGENIVASKDVKGEVTVSLSNVTLEEALDYVAKLSGFGYTKSNGTYLVGARESLKSLNGSGAGTLTTEVVPVVYSNCDDVILVLKAQCPDVQVVKINVRGAGKSSGDSGSTGDSSILISGPADSVAAAKLLVQQVDAPVEREQEIYKVQHVAPDLLAESVCKLVPGLKISGLGISPVVEGEAAAGAAAGGAAGGDTSSKGTPAGEDSGLRQAGVDQTSVKQQRPMNYTSLDNLSRTLVLLGSKEQVTKGKELCAALDVKSPQIKIEAKITSITETGEKKLGLSWDWGNFLVLEDSSAPLVATDPVLNTDVAISNNVSVDKSLNRYWRQPLSFAAKLDALITQGDGKLLASPSLTCLDGKPGQFFVGDQIRYVVLVQQTPQGNNVQTETANVGVQLSVVGHVTDDGYITLNLHPEVSVVRLVEDKSAGINLPIITRRFTDHVVRVKAGQTIVIGGLISQNDIDTLSKVPILGDIPILGQLFRHKSKVKDNSEVVIFITASVVED